MANKFSPSSMSILSSEDNNVFPPNDFKLSLRDSRHSGRKCLLIFSCFRSMRTVWREVSYFVTISVDKFYYFVGWVVENSLSNPNNHIQTNLTVLNILARYYHMNQFTVH